MSPGTLTYSSLCFAQYSVEDNGAKPVGEIVLDIFRLSLGGAAMGLAFGIVTVIILAFFYEALEIEISLTVVTAFLGFWVAQSPSRLSGVICK